MRISDWSSDVCSSDLYSVRSRRRTQARRRAGARLARASFSAARGKLYRDLVAAQRMTRRLTAMRHRLEAVKARTGTREWQVKRRERTRQLIELGGLATGRTSCRERVFQYL